MFEYERYNISLNKTQIKSDDELFKQMVMNKFNEFVECNSDINQRLYREQIEYEIGVIFNSDLTLHFSIITDIVNHAKKNGIIIGPGLGSVPGSLVLFVLGVTNVDPIQHGLIFERFINPTTISIFRPPCFMVHICKNQQKEFYQYLSDRFGEYKSVPEDWRYKKLEVDEIERFFTFQLVLSGDLCVIDNCIKFIKKSNSEITPLLWRPDLNDIKTYQLIQSLDIDNIFLLESGETNRLISQFKPNNFSDIVNFISLDRIGPLDCGLTNSYIERKHGREKFEYLFPELEPILKDTYGLIVYQEQIMKIVEVIANYTMTDADDFRKAIGTKIPSRLEKHENLYFQGVRQNNFDRNKAKLLFDLMIEYGGYGFNKSHATAYGLIRYQMAYLKANYPTEFMDALEMLD